jgi:light-harvesting complex 1 alpha chain
MIDTIRSDMYKIWLIFEPWKTLRILFALLIVLALLIHMILLSTERFNWIEGAGNPGASVTVPQAAPPAQAQTQ